MGISHLKFTGLAEHIGHLLISSPATESSPSLLGRSLCLMEERAFKSYLSFERRRAERSRRAFVLMLLDVSKQHKHKGSSRPLGSSPLEGKVRAFVLMLLDVSKLST